VEGCFSKRNPQEKRLKPTGMTSAWPKGSLRSGYKDVWTLYGRSEAGDALRAKEPNARQGLLRSHEMTNQYYPSPPKPVPLGCFAVSLLPMRLLKTKPSGS